MASINKRYKSEGFSEEARKLLSASWRKGTQKDYCSKFKQFNSWCCSRQIDPNSISLNQIADFLTYLYIEKGLQYRSIVGYRSMHSTVLPTSNGSKGLFSNMLSTTCKSHSGNNFLTGGCELKTTLISLIIWGCCPIGKLSTVGKTVESIER
jgi:hypothetical protein